jgi:carbon-monoxide dehydrogenase medium subunit
VRYKETALAMRPAPFRPHRPHSSAEVEALLAQFGEDAKIIAGGQSLTPMLNLRLARTDHLIDISGLSELRRVTIDGEEVVIGAACRHSDLLNDPAIGAELPILAEATRHVAHPAIRNRGTIGGSLCHADPAAEQPAVCLALEADLVLQSERGRRTVAASDFFCGYYTTAAEPDELLSAIRIPRRPRQRGAFMEYSRRPGDFALAAIAAVVQVEDGVCNEPRITAAGVTDRPVRLAGAERAIAGHVPTAERIAHAAREAFDGVELRGDLHGAADYRQAIGEHLVGLCLIGLCEGERQVAN